MRLMLVVCTMLLSLVVQAEDKIYTWTDANGVTQYGDRPPSNSKSEEVKIRGFNAKQLNISAAQLEGNWRVISGAGLIQDWVIRADGRIQIDIRTGANRTIINGAWQLNSDIFTVTSELVQEIKGGKATVDDSPVQFTYKFLEFESNRFRVFNNGGNLVGTK